MTNVYLLQQVDIFEDLSTNQLKLIDDICKEQSYNQGDVIFEENSPSHEFCIIMDGQVEIQVDPDTIGDGKTDAYKPSTIAVLRRGQSFGEVALVDEGLRSASCRAAQPDTRLLVIERDRLVMLCETYPHLGYRLMYNLAADLAMKIRNTDLRVLENLARTEPENKK